MQSLLVLIKLNLEPLFSFLLCYSERTDHLKCAIAVVWRIFWICEVSTTTRCFLMESFFLSMFAVLNTMLPEFTEKPLGRYKLTTKHSFSLACSEMLLMLLSTHPAARKDILSISSHHLHHKSKLLF